METTHTLPVSTGFASYAQLDLHTRINYKGFNEMKGRQFGTRTKRGQFEVYFRMFEPVIFWELFTRSYRHLAENKYFKGWKTFRAV